MILSDVCRIEDCDRPREKQRTGRYTLCSLHRRRQKDHGHPLAQVQGKRPDGSGSYVGGYLQVRAPRHPLADASSLVLMHRIVLYDAIGPGEHPCHWCGDPVTWDIRRGTNALQADHINSVRDDNRLENLVPSCGSCNTKRAQGIDLTHYLKKVS